METRKQKLIKTLNLVITELKNNTIHYDWTQQESCNCGVVAQAALSVSQQQLKALWGEVNLQLDVIEKQRDNGRINPTWQNAVKNLCPITGEPMTKVFKMLFEAGLTKADIVHLEYMDNPAILAKSGIDNVKTVIIKRSVTKTRTETKSVPHPFGILRFFGAMKTKEIKTEYTETVDKEVLPYESKESLILYLVAWVKILQEDIKYKEGDDLKIVKFDELEKDLLIALADENYELAAILRDEINLR